MEDIEKSLNEKLDLELTKGEDDDIQYGEKVSRAQNLREEDTPDAAKVLLESMKNNLDHYKDCKNYGFEKSKKSTARSLYEDLKTLNDVMAVAIGDNINDE